MPTTSDRPRRRRFLHVVPALLVATGWATAPTAAADDGFGWPLVPPSVVDGFDPPDDPYGPGHRGVDLAGQVGQEVLAAGSGLVVHAGSVGGVGTVTVDHGGLRTTYQPLARWVPLGSDVVRGEPVGVLAMIGSHCQTACLHWGALVGDAYVDPLSLVDPGPSRLLPYWEHGRTGAGAAVEPVVPVRAAGPAGAVAARATTGAAVEPLGLVAVVEPSDQPPSRAVAVVGAVLGGVLAAAAVIVIRRRRE